MEEELYEELQAIEDVHWWLVARRRIFLHFLGDLAARAASQPLVLDCGVAVQVGPSYLLEVTSRFARPAA